MPTLYQTLLFSPFYREGKEHTERSSKTLKVTKLVSGKDRIRSRDCQTLKPVL